MPYTHVQRTACGGPVANIVQRPTSQLPVLVSEGPPLHQYQSEAALLNVSELRSSLPYKPRATTRIGCSCSEQDGFGTAKRLISV